MWGFHDNMGWWMVFGGLWMVAFWAAILGLVVWATSRIGGRGDHRSSTDEPAIKIARNRLARGEITQQQFEGLEKALG